MQPVCSYCRSDLGVRDPASDPRITHGICPACRTHVIERMRIPALPDALESDARAIFVVDRQYRFLTCNRSAEALIGGRRAEFIGLLGGEFLDCDHARSHEGCGHTSACSACKLRGSVLLTAATGAPLNGISAWLDTRVSGLPVRRPVRLSTSRDGEHVQVRIDSVG